MRLWLDDERKPPVGWEWAKTYEEAVAAFQRATVTICSLDHDLGEEHYALLQDPHGYEENLGKMTVATGYHVALWMVKESVFPPRILVHSMNPTGSAAMVKLLSRHHPEGTKAVLRVNHQDVRAGHYND
jgi:hypothetical protein